MPKYNHRTQKCDSCNEWVYPGEGWLISWPYNHVIHKACYSAKKKRVANRVNLKSNQLEIDFN